MHAPDICGFLAERRHAPRPGVRRRTQRAAVQQVELIHLRTRPVHEAIIRICDQRHRNGEGVEAKQMPVDGHCLGALSVPVTLVTDTNYRLLDRSGAVVDQFDLLYSRPLPAPSDTWSWSVAPFGEEAADIRRVHSVTAFPNWHVARADLSRQSTPGS